MLTSKQIQIIKDVFAPYNPKRIAIFGSYAKNINTIKSDIDILYSFNTPISLFQKVTILNLLKIKLKKDIDLVSEKAIHPNLKDEILKNLTIIYEI